MTEHTFDSRPDPELGALLRAQLDARDHAAFAARVVGRLRRGTGSQWEVLAGWARPGIAAALFLAAALGYWIVLGNREPAASRPTEVLAAEQPVDRDAVMSVVLGSER